jgi:hypothetical protein
MYYSTLNVLHDDGLVHVVIYHPSWKRADIEAWVRQRAGHSVLSHCHGRAALVSQTNEPVTCLACLGRGDVRLP